MANYQYWIKTLQKVGNFERGRFRATSGTYVTIHHGPDMNLHISSGDYQILVVDEDGIAYSETTGDKTSRFVPWDHVHCVRSVPSR